MRCYIFFLNHHSKLKYKNNHMKQVKLDANEIIYLAKKNKKSSFLLKPTNS